MYRYCPEFRTFRCCLKLPTSYADCLKLLSYGCTPSRCRLYVGCDLHTHAQSELHKQGHVTTGYRLFRKEFLCFNTMPCRPMPLPVHFRLKPVGFGNRGG